MLRGLLKNRPDTIRPHVGPVPPDAAGAAVGGPPRDPGPGPGAHGGGGVGLDPEQGLGSPWAAAISSMATFAVGAFIPLVPFLFGSGAVAALWAVGLSGATLFGV